MDDLVALRDSMRRFSDEREWDKFHSPKNLAMALAVEASEILEHFQWVAEGESTSLSESKRELVADEIADVLLYLVRLADKLEIDPATAAFRKIEKNAIKYPIEKSKGSSAKYSEL